MVFNICLFTAISFCTAVALKVLHDSLRLLLSLLNTYLLQQMRNLAYQAVIACIRDWKLSTQDDIHIKMHPKDEIVAHEPITYRI